MQKKHADSNKYLLWFVGMCFFSLYLVSYIPAIQGGFIWDDDAHITENVLLRSPEGLKRFWLDPKSVPSRQVYPLTFTTFWLEYQFWGTNPAGYHFVNVILHALNALLLLLVLKRLQIPGAWLAAAVFALHPVHVESVAWVSERKNVLSAFFYLISLWAYIGFAGKEFGLTKITAAVKGFKRNRQKNFLSPPWLLYAISFITYLLALLSKTVTSTLPAAILLLLWWKTGRIRRNHILLLLPFFVSGIYLGLQTAWLEKHNVGAYGLEWHFSFIERCLIAGRALWFYAAKLFWPFNLTFNYPRWEIDAGLWWQYLFPLAAVAVLVILLLLRQRISRGPFTAVAFFVGTLFPALGFFNIYPMRYSFVADHFQYLASIGLLLPACHWLSRFTGRSSYQKKYTYRPLVMTILAALGFLTWQQGHIYKSSEVLWHDTIEKNPTSYLAHTNMGAIYYDKGDYRTALNYFKKAQEINPEDDAANYFRMGSTLTHLGNTKAATFYFVKALEVDPNNAENYYNLGVLYFSTRQFDKAKYYFKEALKINPDYQDASNYLNLIQ
jgi:tetratricopeptide (TPR) repeat protein